MNTEKTKTKKKGIPRIESLKVENFRALKKVSLDKLTPMTVLLGPNGSGKSTVFDVFNFLSECFQYGLRHAWERRGRARELKSRGAEGPIVFELKYREQPGTPIITYHLAIDEGKKGPEVVEEWLKWRRGNQQPCRFIEIKKGIGTVISGEFPSVDDERKDINFRSPDIIAVSTLGQFSEYPRVSALSEFITDWHISYMSIDQTRNQPKAGPQGRLSKTGENLLNVIQYLKEQHPNQLEKIFEILRRRIPRLEQVLIDITPNDQLRLQIKDAPFLDPISAKYVSDGTMKMLGYLILLHHPEPPRFIGIEEPENFLHPRLLYELAEECRAAAEKSQLLITSHSPFFVNGIHSDEVIILYRNDAGFSQAVRASDIRGIPQMSEAGGALGHLWMEGHFGLGDPLVNSGAPGPGIKRKK